VVPYAPGGATDVLSRLLCQRLSDRLGQTFIVENKPGAGSNIGTQAVIASAADGHTLLLTSTANAINASFDPNLGYDFAASIDPVAGVAQSPLVLVVNNDVPARNTAEFIAFAKRNPDKLSIASSGLAPRSISRANCSNGRPASATPTCPTGDPRRDSPT
jgi:tripartite-type tricarboxylate transporter receptor subunit TctC